MTTKKPVNLLKGEQSQFPVQVVPGMRVLRYDYVRLVDINATNQNWGRISGVTTAGRDGIRRMIQDGTYLPQHFEPPVIDQDGNLIAGKHRFDAHDAEGEEYMWVAVCEFDDDDARNTYANDENMRNTFKTMQTPEDFIFAHAQIVKRGDKVAKTKNAVSNYIKRNYPQLPMNYPSRSKLAEEILITAGVDFVPIEIMTDEKIISEYYEEYGIDIVEDPSYILKKLTGAKDLKRSDRWARLMRDLTDGISTGVNYTVITTFTGANSESIPELRKTCLDFYDDMIENAKKLITGQARKKLGSVNFIFTKQLPEDEVFNEIN